MSTTDAPKKPRETDDVPVPATLRKSLKNRHIQLIALGGAIGTGLFYGSSESIALAGRIDPSVGRKNRILRFFGGQSNFFRFFSLDLLEY